MTCHSNVVCWCDNKLRKVPPTKINSRARNTQESLSKVLPAGHIMEVISAPVISLQHDWDTALNSKTKETAWIASSTYDTALKKTVAKHGEITFTHSEGSLTTPTSTPPFSVSIVNAGLKWLRVTNTETHNATDIFAPTRKLQDSSKKAIRSLGLSPQGGLGVFGCEDGILRVCDTQDGSIRRNLEGHKGDVTVSSFFPSGQVVLSGALDWRLKTLTGKIWNVGTGECATTLTGHGGSILGADFIDRGRNIISCSRDGTARLWDVPTQATITTFTTPGDPGFRSAVNDCCVFSQDGTHTEKSQDQREVGTEGKAIVMAGEDGVLRVFDIQGTRNEVATFPSPPTTANGSTRHDAYNCCASAHLSGTGRTIIGGTESGNIIAWDLRTQATPLHALRFTSSSIKKLTFSATGKLWAATGDGATVGIRWDARAAAAAVDRARVDVSLSGSDCEPVVGLGVASVVDGPTVVATGARDGFVRLYWVYE